jgi:hypothetical protein
MNQKIETAAAAYAIGSLRYHQTDSAQFPLAQLERVIGLQFDRKLTFSQESLNRIVLAIRKTGRHATFVNGHLFVSRRTQ